MTMDEKYVQNDMPQGEEAADSCNRCGVQHDTFLENFACLTQNLSSEKRERMENNEEAEKIIPQQPVEKEKDKEVWSQEQTEALLSLVKANYDRLTSKGEKKKKVWLDIQEAMSHIMPGITKDQVERKWLNLKQKFQKFEKSKQTYVPSRIKKPPCYKLLATLLAEHVAHPAYATNSESTSPQPVEPEIEIVQDPCPSAGETHGGSDDVIRHRKRRLASFHPQASAARVASLLQEDIEERKRHNQDVKSQLENMLSYVERQTEQQQLLTNGFTSHLQYVRERAVVNPYEPPNVVMPETSMQEAQSFNVTEQPPNRKKKRTSNVQTHAARVESLLQDDLEERRRHNQEVKDHLENLITLVKKQTDQQKLLTDAFTRHLKFMRERFERIDAKRTKWN